MLHLVNICLAIIAIALSVVLSVMCKRVKEMEVKLINANNAIYGKDQLNKLHTLRYRRLYKDYAKLQKSINEYHKTQVDIKQLAEAKNVSVDQICKELNIPSDNEE